MKLKILQLLDKNHNKIKGLISYRDLKIESVLSTGDKTLSFLYPKKLSKGIENEGYIQTKEQEYVIKEVAETNEWNTITATLNLEELEGNPFESFDSTEQTISKCMQDALAGSGWTTNIIGNITKKRTVRKTNSNSLQVLEDIRKTYLVEMEFDTLNKIVNVYEKIGSYKGCYFIDCVNLRKLDVTKDSYDFYTKIIAVGATNEDTKATLKVVVTNNEYSSKVKTLLWKDERYTVEESLREDAKAKLEEISKPKIMYEADINDLANMNEKYKNVLEYSLGDTVLLIDKEKGIKEKQRIVKITECPYNPEDNTCELSNTIYSFEDILRSQQATENTVTNITMDNGTVSPDAIKQSIIKLINVDVQNLNAVSARIGELFVNQLKADVANVTTGIVGKLLAQKIETKDLVASNVKFDIAEGGSLSLKDLLTQFLSANSTETLHLTAGNVVIDKAVIKDLIAAKISVGDLLAGNIDSERFNIVSKNGNLIIKDNTIQIKDSNRVRIQIGKDASGDYTLNAWDKNGKLLFNSNGITADAIKSKIIRDDMVADNANIDGSKVNIESLIECVNNNNTKTLNASKIVMDGTSQTMNVAFKQLTTTVEKDEKDVETLQTNFNVQQGQINQLIKDTTIEESGTTKTLKDAYNETKSTVDGTVQTVSKMETQVNSLNLTNLIRAGGGDYLNVSSSIWSKANFVSTDTFTLDGSETNKWYRIFNTSSSTASNSGAIYVTNAFPIKAPSDKKISVSFRYYCNDSNGALTSIKNIRMYILQEHNNSGSFYNSYKMVELDKTTGAKLYKGTFELNSNCTRYMIRFDLANNAIASGVTTAFRFKDIMVVNGSIPANEWSPSFEDLQVDINSIESRVSSCEVKTTDEAFTVQVQKNQNRQFNIRYIRDWLHGNNVNNYNSWCDIQVYSNVGTNLALNKTVTSNHDFENKNYIVDGDTHYSKYAGGYGVEQYVQIDLGQVYTNIDEIKVWHYYKDGRKYHNTKTEVSADGTHWVTLFDSAVSGTYPETVYGHSIKVNGTSFNSSKVTINELGLHVKNGAIDIQNNAGDTVFSSDANGNLSLVGNITTKNNTTQKKCISLEGENINFYDWSNSTTRTTPVGTLYSSRMDYNANVPGIVLAHNKNAYMSFAYYNENDKTYHSYMTFDNDFITGKQYSAIKFNKTAVIGDDLFFGDKWAWMDGYSSNIWVNISTKNETDWSGKFGICKQDGTGVFIVKPYSADSDAVWTNRNTYINGDFCVSGNKNCVQHTDNYGDIKMYATEDFGSYFTWRPEGNFECNKKDSDNNYYTIIKIPEVVREVVNTNIDYIVQIMKLSFGDYKIKTFPGYFKVVSDKQLEFRIDYLKGYRKDFEDENYYNQLSKPVQLSNHSHNRIVKK